MKVLLGAVLLVATGLVSLGPTFGFNLSPEKLLEILSGAPFLLGELTVRTLGLNESEAREAY